MLIDGFISSEWPEDKRIIQIKLHFRYEMNLLEDGLMKWKNCTTKELTIMTEIVH